MIVITIWQKCLWGSSKEDSGASCLGVPEKDYWNHHNCDDDGVDDDNDDVVDDDVDDDDDYDGDDDDDNDDKTFRGGDGGHVLRAGAYHAWWSPCIFFKFC